MKNVNRTKILKKICFVLIGIYVIYTFLSQQKTLSNYQTEQARYSEQIATEKEKKAELNSTKENINSKEYIEEVAREKLNMYLPNEKVYIDIAK